MTSINRVIVRDGDVLEVHHIQDDIVTTYTYQFAEQGHSVRETNRQSAEAFSLDSGMTFHVGDILQQCATGTYYQIICADAQYGIAVPVVIQTEGSVYPQYGGKWERIYQGDEGSFRKADLEKVWG